MNTNLNGRVLREAVANMYEEIPLAVLCHLVNLTCIMVLILSGLFMPYIQIPAVVLGIVFSFRRL